MDKDSNEYVSAEKYLRMLFPGVMLPDATGRLVPPEYDMTLDQFNAVQSELESSMEEAIEDAESQMDDSIDIEQFIELEETIDVRVLMPDGGVVEKQLEIYVLDIPDGVHNKAPCKSRMIYRWHSEDGENTCDECASRDGEIYTNESDIPEIPVHPNCRCSITQDEVDATGQPIRSKPYTPKKKDIIMNKVLTKELRDALKQHEGFKQHPYLDSKGILTIGIGNNVNTLKNFLALEFIDTKDGHTLTNNEKEALYTNIMADVGEKTFSEKIYARYQVPNTHIENKFNQQLEQSYHELEKKIQDFKTLPIPVQQALLDMQFNMGNAAFQLHSNTVAGRTYSGWPKLFDAIKRHDWTTAAKESRRLDVQASRNQWTYNKFIQI